MDSKITIETMPKYELHCHLDGSLPVAFVQEILKEQGEEWRIEELKKRLQVTDDCQSLTEYLEKFDLPLRCMTTPRNLQRAAYAVVKEAAAENVRYMEIRFAPMLSVNDTMDCATVIEQVVLGLKRAQEEFGVYTSAITCAMRHHDEETNLAMMRTAREFLGNGVCALDLAGDESAYPTREFRKLFLEAKKLDFPYTIHSGECGSVENVEEAVALGACRMGHGIALRHNPKLQKICAERKIGIETCPVSNFHTKAVRPEEIYPLADFLKQGLAVSVNTDNRTVSNTSLTREFTFLTQQLGIGTEFIDVLLRNAVETSFADDSVKQELLREL